MCGITGIIHLNGKTVDLERFSRFNNMLEHRGPDGFGISTHLNDTIALGHRRLSILDLSEAGKQPMSYANGRFTITFNGEIFNFLELRSELKLAGFHFQTETDTEVVLAAYEHWGEDCLHRFNGMWAFALWDEHKNQLFIARDRFGIKPLFYLHAEDFIAFASETNAFRAIEYGHTPGDSKVIQAFLDDPDRAHGLGLTPFKNVFQVLPGHYATYSDSSGLIQRRWYDLVDETRSKNAYSFNEQSEQFFELFKDSLKLRMRSDVPMATALSGGLDSSSVYALIKYLSKDMNSLERTHSDNSKAFVATFPGFENDEEAYARKLVQHVKGEAVFFDASFSNQELETQINRSVVHLDSVTTNPLLSVESIYAEMRSQGYKISMDGHGVDEMLFGYRKMLFDAFDQALTYRRFQVAEEVAKVLVELYHPSRRKAAAAKMQERIVSARNWKSKLKSYLGPKPNADRWNKLQSEFNAMTIKGQRAEDPNHIAFDNFLIAPLPSILRRFDHAAMRNSVEIRMPFMDYRLVEFVFSLPFESKMSNGFTKRILRESMSKMLPASIAERKFKVGIQSPLVGWLEGSLKSMVIDTVHSKDFLESSLFDGAEWSKKVESSYQSGWSGDVATDFWKHYSLHLITQQV